MKKNMIN
jgi:hypothetical protein